MHISLTARLFLVYALFVAVCAYGIARIVTDEIKPGVRQTTEETLVDTANLLAEILAKPVKQGSLENSDFVMALDRYGQRTLNADIWGFKKLTTNHRVYVTDARGIVLLDSHHLAVGQDYSRWNDVRRTLKGEYGARSSTEMFEGEPSTVMYVSAPIRDGDAIIGVVSVSKPNRTLQPFIDRTQKRLALLAAGILVIGLVVGGLLSWWLGRELHKLREYAIATSRGERAGLPKNALKSRELQQLAESLHTMRTELDGKAYVEHFFQTFAHELKSPLAGIRAAVELLQQPMDESSRQRFLTNIDNESQRLERLLERLLQQTKIEQLQHLGHRTAWPVHARIQHILQHLHTRLAAKRLHINMQVPNQLRVLGDETLLEQAVINLIDNAIDFASPGSALTLSCTATDHICHIIVENIGPHIPEYAIPRLRERFYSLPRPDTGKKSTGLGLSFVNEVASLHEGEFSICNVEQGVRAKLSLPLHSS